MFKKILYNYITKGTNLKYLICQFEDALLFTYRQLETETGVFINR